MRNVDDQNLDNLDEAIQSLKSIQVELTPSARANLARQCAQQVSQMTRRGVWGRILHVFLIPVPQKGLAAAMGMVLLAVLAGVLVLEKPRSQAPGQTGDSKIQLVSLSPDASGRITLQWRDGSQRTYTVLKSDNPRDFSRAIAYSVRGNRWTDPNSEANQLAFYRVE
jgi:hypothetical protein